MDVQASMAPSSQKILNGFWTLPIVKDPITKSPRTAREVLIHREVKPLVLGCTVDNSRTVVDFDDSCFGVHTKHGSAWGSLLGHVTDTETPSLPSARNAGLQV